MVFSYIEPNYYVKFLRLTTLVHTTVRTVRAFSILSLKICSDAGGVL